MKRRDYLKSMMLGSILPMTNVYGLVDSIIPVSDKEMVSVFRSDWDQWPNMKWAGPNFWANRLQDWRLENGKAICQVKAPNRQLNVLPIQNENSETLNISITIEPKSLNEEKGITAFYGLQIGMKGNHADHRNTAVFGNGLKIGLNNKGEFLIGDSIASKSLSTLPRAFTLDIHLKKNGQKALIEASIKDASNDVLLLEYTHTPINYEYSIGGIGLLVDHGLKKDTIEEDAATFENLKIDGEKLIYFKERQFGPICFAQYTVHERKLKLTAQLCPIEAIEGHKVFLELFKNGHWQPVAQEKQLSHLGRALNFVVDKWNPSEEVLYRVRLDLPLKSGITSFYYEGSISSEPTSQDNIKAAVFSCNFHYGFPDADVVEAMKQLNPDIILFLGDQFYEGTGGYGAEYSDNIDKLSLDYLRKWMMFGWSYRDIFRHKPCAIIPDDHDVYHGNLWGESGKAADNSMGFGAKSQDSGGYKMPAEWVNMVQFTQTSHLPDPYDPTPVKQNISVYYTNWNYGGISFAILEDRKFKSAPAHVLPKEAEVNNGWIMSDDFDIKEHRHLEADLLGERQERFLDEWTKDWSNGVEMKAVLSQTNFATVATLPEGAKTGAVIPSLPIPEKGEYVKGDRPTVDMDSNGWPAPKRDKAVEIIRKAYAFHIAGDQHLGSFIQYGVDMHGDSGHAFAGPALNNIWPRRFWPDVPSENHSYKTPAYTGDHTDGFGNKMTVLAVANPHQTHQEPKILHDRAVGYGLVTFNKKERTITTNCWPRFINPKEKDSQYPGWPITIRQEDNFAKKAVAWLPELIINSEEKPVCSIFDEDNRHIYSLRLKTNSFRPKVFRKGRYRIELEWTNSNKKKMFERLKARRKQHQQLKIPN